MILTLSVQLISLRLKTAKILRLLIYHQLKLLILGDVVLAETFSLSPIGIVQLADHGLSSCCSKVETGEI